MLSPLAVKIISSLPDNMLFYVAKKIMLGYIKKYANIVVKDFDKVDKVEGTKIFICNHLSNSDGLVLSKILKEKDKVLAIMPVFHGFGLGICIHTVQYFGGTSILLPQFSSKTFDKLLKK